MRISVRGLGRVKWWLVGVVMFAALLFTIRATGVSLSDLTRDTAAVAGGAPWHGLISQLGLMVWGAAAGACIVAALMLREAGAPSEGVLFMGSTAAFTAVVAIDDGVQLHEDVLPGVGIPEMAVKLVLCLAALVWLVRFRALILESDLLLLGFAVLFLGASFIADAALEPIGVPIEVEDFFKYVGIAAYASWCFSTAGGLVSSEIRRSGFRKAPSQV